MANYFHITLPDCLAWFKRRWGLVGVVVSLAVMAAGGGIFLFFRHHLAEARQALERHDLAAAAPHLDQCLRVWPRSEEARLLAARVARCRDDIEGCQRHLAILEKLDDPPRALRLERLLLSVQQGRFDREDEANLLSLTKGGRPEAALILEALYKGYLKTARLTDMVSCLDSLLALQPDHVPARLERGRAWESIHRAAEAEADYRHAVAIQPGDLEPRLRLASFLFQRGRTREATAQFECLRQRHPADPDVLLGLCGCRLDSANLEECEHLLEALLAEHPNHPRGLIERGRIAFRRGRDADAEAWARRALNRSPHERDALRLLLLSLRAQGKTNEAEQCQRRLYRVEVDRAHVGQLMLRLLETPRDTSLRIDLGLALMRAGREEHAAALLEGILAQEPFHASIHEALAGYYERIGRPEQAAVHRRQAGPGGMR